MRAYESKQKSDRYIKKITKPKTYLDYLYKSDYSESLKEFGRREFISNYKKYKKNE